MKQTLTSAIFSFLFFVSGLSASASTYNPLGTTLTETDTNEVQVEIEGIDPDSGLVSALSEIIAVSTQDDLKGIQIRHAMQTAPDTSAPNADLTTDDWRAKRALAFKH